MRIQSNRPAVLVTGGAGYIGSHACKALAGAGYTPVTFDSLIYGHREAVKWGPLIEGDLADRNLLNAVMRDYSIEAVVHFAAFAYVGESMQEPGKYFHNNVTNTINLLEAMRDNDIASIVFSSTCATYGMPQHLPIDESHPQVPVNPYGESKLFIEKALHWFGVAHGIRSVALRYFNAAGADPDGEIGEQHDPETHLIPLIIETALGQREAIDVYGTDYPTPDGTAIRDYIHVRDLAEAHVLALGYLFDEGESTCINLGTGQGYSVREVIDAVAKCSGRNITTRECPRRAGDPAELVADARRARQLLQWSPDWSSLEQIIETAFRWHEHGGGYADQQLSENPPAAAAGGSGR
jgi:UDP-glucose-4-epimerase GalE